MGREGLPIMDDELERGSGISQREIDTPLKHLHCPMSPSSSFLHFSESSPLLIRQHLLPSLRNPQPCWIWYLTFSSQGGNLIGDQTGLAGGASGKDIPDPSLRLSFDSVQIWKLLALSMPCGYLYPLLVLVISAIFDSLWYHSTLFMFFNLFFTFNL